LASVGLVGLGVMGRNLALNLSRRGYKVVVYNRTKEVTDRFISGYGGSGLTPAYSPDEVARKLDAPRIILLMVTAGKAVDDVIRSISPYLSSGDVLSDLGNSHFRDTQRREFSLDPSGIHYCGVGVSGGEEGALRGPSIMVGGPSKAWEILKKPMSDISARAFDGTPCASWVGEDGAGHYVKMVHNAIEYVVMELIGECYGVFKALDFSNGEISDIFQLWNEGRSKSYLLEISAKVLRRKDELSGGDLVDKILDSAEQKGTGKWAAESCLELGVPAFSFAVAALDRSMSSFKLVREKASSLEPNRVNKPNLGRREAQEALGTAFSGAQLCAYAQGFSLLEAARNEYGWHTDLAEVARIWQGGCIIRADLLKQIREALLSGAHDSILLDPDIHREIVKCDKAWRNVVSRALEARIPLPGFTSTLAYRDSLFTERLPANLIQALRDYFGAHTYRRVDREGVFHTDWSGG